MSQTWRENFIKTYIERDIPQLGFRIPAPRLRSLLTMCAHLHGQVLNISTLGKSLDLTHNTIRKYLDLLQQTFIIRQLPSYHTNTKKRLVKAPKIFVRDSGILHQLLQIDDLNALSGHPVYGFSYEGYVVESIINALPQWQGFFYRTSNGNELDLILTRGQQTIAIEIKASRAPNITRGFWNAIDDIKPTQTWVIAPVAEPYQLTDEVTVSNVKYFLTRIT